MTGTPMISDPESFWQEARYQGVCAETGRAGAFHAHHVVARQRLRDLGLPEWDTRNALRLFPDAHTLGSGHHSGSPRRQKVRTRSLLDCNIEYAVEVLGAAAGDYLRRHYDNSDPDPRLEALCPGT